MLDDKSDILVTILSNIITTIKGPLGTLICSVALVVAGVCFFVGFGSRRMIFGIVGGVALIWGSAYIVSTILGLS